MKRKAILNPRSANHIPAAMKSTRIEEGKRLYSMPPKERQYHLTSFASARYSRQIPSRKYTGAEDFNEREKNSAYCLADYNAFHASVMNFLHATSFLV